MSVPSSPSAATPTRPGPKAPNPPVSSPQPADPDWTDQVADLIVDVVDRVHDRTTGPAVSVAKAAVYGTVAVLVLPVVVVLLLIFVVRVLGLLLDDHLWAGYLGLGVVLVLGGFFAWSKRPVLGGRP
jgi:hypothetical protein